MAVGVGGRGRQVEPFLLGELADRSGLPLAVRAAERAAGVDAVDDLARRADRAVEAELARELLDDLLQRRRDDVDGLAALAVAGDELRAAPGRRAASGPAPSRSRRGCGGRRRGSPSAPSGRPPPPCARSRRSRRARRRGAARRRPWRAGRGRSRRARGTSRRARARSSAAAACGRGRRRRRRGPCFESRGREAACRSDVPARSVVHRGLPQNHLPGEPRDALPKGHAGHRTGGPKGSVRRRRGSVSNRRPPAGAGALPAELPRTCRRTAQRSLRWADFKLRRTPKAKRNPHDFFTDSVARAVSYFVHPQTEGIQNMKRTVFVVAALAALVASSVAVATLRSGNVSPVSATLSAPTTVHVSTRTLTCDSQTIEITTGRYTGTSTSTTPDLAGPVELRVHSVYNTTTKLGTVNGTLKIGAADDRSKAAFTAINSDGKLDGWLRGSAGHRDGAIFGSLSGSFSKTGGLTDGQLGTGTGANTAVLAKRAECKKSESTRPSVRLTRAGQVERSARRRSRSSRRTAAPRRPARSSRARRRRADRERRQGRDDLPPGAGSSMLAKVRERR